MRQVRQVRPERSTTGLARIKNSFEKKNVKLCLQGPGEVESGVDNILLLMALSL